MEGVPTAEINISNSEVIGDMKATAVLTEPGNTMAGILAGPMGIIPVGVGAMGYDSAAIRITDSKVMVTAKAMAHADDGQSGAMAGIYSEGRLFDMPGPPNSLVSGLVVGGMAMSDAVEGLADSEVPESVVTSVALQRSFIGVTAEATAEDYCSAAAAGIQLLGLDGEKEGAVPTLTMTDSTVQVSAKATKTVTKEMGPEALDANATAIGINAVSNGGGISLSLDHAMVATEASATIGSAFGIKAEGWRSTYDIHLSNGTQIMAHSESEKVNVDNPSSAAIFVDGASAIITVDATSSLEGEWAVAVTAERLEIRREDPVVTLNNSGLVKGRLGGVVLNNASTGTLQATFGSGDGCVYDAAAEDQAFYFITNTATLADGTTFRVVPDDLGLAKPGDSNAYALLESAETGNWDQKQLNLKAVGDSPLLGLKWSENSTDKTLIAEIEFMTPAEAGLSGNAGSAFAAALADKDSAFLFNTDPEAWSPNVSGAFLTGMTQTLGASNANIGNRLGGLMGLNTGDEIVAAGGLWYNAAFTDADQSKRDGIAGFDADTAGISLGLDRQAGPVTAGVAFTVGNTDADADDSSSSMGMKDNLFSLYGSYDGGRWFSEAVLSAGVGSVDSTRRLDSQVLTANYDSTSYNALAKVGMKLSSAGWQINPLVAVDYSYKKYDSYTEEGGSGALSVDSQDYTVINVGGGLHAAQLGEELGRPYP